MNKRIMMIVAVTAFFVVFQSMEGRAATRGPAPTFERIKEMARDLAVAPYKDTRVTLSKTLETLSYDQTRDIRFNVKESVWRREHLPFQLQFFHPGGGQKDQIDIHLVDGENVKDFPFDRDLFDYGKNNLSWFDLRGVKYSGFRIHYPLNTTEYLDELIVFQGATYFRALPKGLIYGLSARTVAINCASDRPEEFPRFQDFWVVRPDKEGRSIQIYGLLDGPSVAGAASFLIEPGVETVVHMRVALFARTNLVNYGIAPLTSMYWFGKNNARRFDEFRPEVHDSDGLLILNGKNEWLWRTLENTGPLRLSAFTDNNPNGFGLIQRERNFSCYEDLETMYHRRPSAWVKPVGSWGEGAVRLVEIGTWSEFHDNIVAYWQPAKALKPGESAEYAYDLVWYDDNPNIPSLGRLVSLRSGLTLNQSNARKFVLDFVWPTLTRDVAGVKPEVVVTAGGGRISGLSDEYNPNDRTWRVAFDVTPEKASAPVELRAVIRKDGAPCTETWTYLWMP